MINEIHLENLNQAERLIERNPGQRPRAQNQGIFIRL